MAEATWIGPVAASLVGVVGVIITAILNYAFSRNRFFREKDWEKKREIHGEIIAELKSAERFAERIVHNFEIQNKETFVQSDQFLEWVEETLKAYINAQDCLAKNFLFVSSEIRKRFEELEEEFRVTSENLVHEQWARYQTLFRSAIMDLHDQALREV